MIGWIDLTIIIAFLLGTIAVGLYYARRNTGTAEGFFLAGRSLTWPLIGASVFASNISSQHFVGQGGMAYSIGIRASIFQLCGSLAILFVGLWLIPKFLRAGIFTFPELMERRFGQRVRQILSGLNIAMLLTANLAGVLYAGAMVLTALLGWSGDYALYGSVVGLAILAAAYTYSGGLTSVVVTDFIQNLVLIIGGLATLGFTLYLASKEPGGFEGLWQMTATTTDGVSHSKWSLFDPVDHPAFPLWGVLTGGLMFCLANHATDQEYLQRQLGARSERHAQLGALLAAFLKVVAIFIIAVPGVIAGYILHSPDIRPDQMYANLIVEVLPIGVRGLVLAALLASILSTIDSSLAAISSLFTVDFYLRKRPEADEGKRVKVGRWAILAASVLGIAWTPIIAGFDYLYVYLISVLSHISAPFLVCLIAAFWDRRATRRGVEAGLFAGLWLGGAFFAILNLAKIAADDRLGAIGLGQWIMALHEALPSWLTGMHFLYASFWQFAIGLGIQMLVSRMGSSPVAQPAQETGAGVSLRGLVWPLVGYALILAICLIVFW